MITDPARVPLNRRAWIGNGVSGALVSADGTVDWYCPEGFTSPAALWRLLDPAGGALRVGPERSGSSATRTLPAGTQRYRQGSNVVETVLEGAGGRRVSVLDFLDWQGPGLDVTTRIIRIVRALSGPVDVELELLPSGRFAPAREVRSSSDGLVFDGTMLRAGMSLEAAAIDRRTPRWRASRRLDEGDAFVVTVDADSRAEPLTVDGAMRLAESTEQAWRSWLGVLAYDGAYREMVERSLLAVRSLTGVRGAPAGAGTTSLPRRIGSERTSDDRWVRWRDAAAAALSFSAAGLAEDCEAAETWLRDAVTGAPLPWPVWLDHDGQPPPALETLSLEGWRRSGPVVVGVREGVTDLDCYGDVVATVGASTTGPGGRAGEPGPLSAAWPALASVADWVADHWREPDSGVWASPGPPGMLVASRVQAWSALDRMARLARAANPLDLAAAGWQQEARSILRWLETDGLSFDGGLRRDGNAAADDEPDAALLRIAWRGPWPASHPVVVRTVDRILDRLTSSGLLFRHSERVDDGQAGPDNPDLLASLWAVRALAALERWEEAHERMEAVVALAGPAGLLSEAADPVAVELMGNLPCTAVHLALVDAAISLSRGPA
ncbi:MAG TPA: glycoside hydrolase family 15 protein [Acidimicrobiales bacterium]|nr:glycoside hydrolase family 15 protein [Acidimicrobiales bacterium]